MKEIKVDKILDVRGRRCPYPLLKTTKEVASMKAGETLLVIADDPMAPDNIDSWAEKEGHQVLDVNKVGKEIRIYVAKKKGLEEIIDVFRKRRGFSFG